MAGQRKLPTSNRVWWGVLMLAIIVSGWSLLTTFDQRSTIIELRQGNAALRQQNEAFQDAMGHSGISFEWLTAQEYAAEQRKLTAQMRRNVEAEKNPIVRASLAASYYCRVGLPQSVLLRQNEAMPTDASREHWDLMGRLYNEAAAQVPAAAGMPDFLQMMRAHCPGQ